MAQIELIMPKMGESVAEATITNWLKQEGDAIELDEAVVEIATDKVDSEVPSTSEGVLIKKLFNDITTFLLIPQNILYLFEVSQVLLAYFFLEN